MWAFRPVYQENSTPGGGRQMHRSMPHYCIATGCELWFERLDFDAFRRSGPGAPKVHLKAVGGAWIVQHSQVAMAGMLRGSSHKERERHDDVEGPEWPPV